MIAKEQLIEEYPEHSQDDFEKSLDGALAQGHLAYAKQIIDGAHIADLADFLDRTTIQQKEKILNLVSKQQLCQLIIELDVTVIPRIIEMIGYQKAAEVINDIDIDEAIYVLDSLEDELNKFILDHLKPSKRKEIAEGLSYPEDSAGRLMQRKFISVPEYWTIGQTIDYLQHKQECPEIFYEIFVTDPKFSPIGSVPLSVLVVSKRETIINSVMRHDIKPVKTDLEEEEVSYLFKKYGFVNVPVVNKHNRLVGVITLGDAFDVIDKHAEENLMHMGGVQEDDVHLSVIEVIKSRFPWLLISLLATIMCSLVVNFFHNTIQQAVILSAIMPIVAGISGNAGTQTMTVTVLSLSSKELTAINITRVIMKQIISCSCNGLVLAILGGLILGVLYHNTLLSFIFGMAVTINFALAGFLGSVIPIILNRAGFDPAVASPVFITTLTDMLSFAIFLSLASILLI